MSTGGARMPVKIRQRLEVNSSNMDLQLFADGDFAASEFFNSNKKITASYREAYAQAIGTTGKIPIIKQMAFGTGGEVDSQGNPAPPTDDGPLNTVVLVKDIASVTYPVSTTVCFEAEIDLGEATASINEVALLDEDGNTAAKIRLLTSKGIDAESGLVFRWYVEF